MSITERGREREGGDRKREDRGKIEKSIKNAKESKNKSQNGDGSMNLRVYRSIKLFLLGHSFS
jgi:hypothetical protein